MILSEHGEGYCRACRFVVGLREDGKIALHERTSSGTYGERIRVECEGSYARPPRAVPFYSRKSAFVVNPQRRDCAVCGRNQVAVVLGHLSDHYPLSRQVETVNGHCPGR